MIRTSVQPAANRFLRRSRNEQVRKSRRARSLLRSATWIGLHVAVMALVILAAWAGHRYLTHSERFTVRRVLVAGSGYAPARQIRAVTDRYLGKNVFTSNLEALQSALEAAPWIKTVHAKRRIPNVLLIQVEERVPEVLVKIHEGIYLADGEGVLLDRYGPDYADYDFPILTGLDGAGRETLRRKIRLGAAFVDYLYRTRPQFADSVSEIDVGDDRILEVRLNDGSVPIRLSPDVFGLNLDNYLTMRNFISSNYGDVRYVDLRWKDRISIMPAAGRISEHGAKR